MFLSKQMREINAMQCIHLHILVFIIKIKMLKNIKKRIVIYLRLCGKTLTLCYQTHNMRQHLVYDEKMNIYEI